MTDASSGDTEKLLELVRALRLETEAKDATIAEQKRALRFAQQKIEHLLRRLFGRSSEKLDPHQIEMTFEEAQAAVAAAAESEAPVSASTAPDAAPDDEATSSAPAAPAKKGHGRNAIPAHIERRRIDVPPQSTCCPACARDLVRIREEVTEELGFEPAKRFVTQYVRGIYACRSCESVAETAPLPERAAERVRPGASVLADIVVKKYADHLPLARQEKILAREGIVLSRSTLCDWTGLAADLLDPVYDAIRAEVLAADVLHSDDTPVIVQDNARGAKRQQCYLWIYRNLAGDTFFDFRRSRSRDGPAAVLSGWKGHLVCDAYAGYHGLFKEGGIVAVSCWAHARRYFFEAFQAGEEDAALVLTLIARLYRVEAEAKECGLDAAARRALRQERSKPQILQLERVLAALAVSALPKGPLGRAVAYTRTLWPSLTRYLDDGRLPIDNNPAEQAIRAVAIGRKNWLFAGGDEGGRRAARFYSVLASCRSVGVEPFAYLTDVLGRVQRTPTSQVAELTPRRWAAARG